MSIAYNTKNNNSTSVLFNTESPLDVHVDNMGRKNNWPNYNIDEDGNKSWWGFLKDRFENTHGKYTEQIFPIQWENFLQADRKTQIEVAGSGQWRRGYTNYNGDLETKATTSNHILCDPVALFFSAYNFEKELRDECIKRGISIFDLYVTFSKSELDKRELKDKKVEWDESGKSELDGRYTYLSFKKINKGSKKLGHLCNEQNVNDFLCYYLFSETGSNRSSSRKYPFWKGEESKENGNSIRFNTVDLLITREAEDAIEGVLKEVDVENLSQQEILDQTKYNVENVKRVLSERDLGHIILREYERTATIRTSAIDHTYYSESTLEDDKDEHLRILELTRQGKWSRNHPSVNG